MSRYRYTAIVQDFERDMYGNPTAHFKVWDKKAGFSPICQSGSRREQSGYDGTGAEAALWKLEEVTGRRFKIIVLRHFAYSDAVEVGFKIIPDTSKVKIIK